MKSQGKIFILSGPSGSGKTTLYRKLLKSPKLKGRLIKAVSVTTRLPRKGEKNGKDYFFVSKKMFLYKKKAGHFLESETVFNEMYGTPKKPVFEKIKEGKNVILCIDVKGARTVHRKIKDAIMIFIRTKTLKELEKRLRNRGSEDNERLNLRLKTAREELKEANAYNYQIINDKLSTSIRNLENIILQEIKNT